MVFSKSQSLSDWYEEIIVSAGIASPGLVKGTLFIHPKGTSIWEGIRNFIDSEYKKLGVKNVLFSSLLPLSELQKEKDFLEAFNPELFLVTKKSNESPSLFLRPTSEIQFSHFFKKILNSYEQLPLLFNQWCGVYRLEKNTRAFLRNSEFYWQELHAIFMTIEDSMSCVESIHLIYKIMVQKLLCMSVLSGEKTIYERFPGSEKTLTLEAVMPDGQCLQIATTHFLSQNFSKIFNVCFSNKNNCKQAPFQISAGTSTRLIGGLILDHGDDFGLLLPLGLVDVQIKVLVIGNVVKEGDATYTAINNQICGYSFEWDFSDKSFGFKIKNEELLGTPILIVVGEKELKKSTIMFKSRLCRDKQEVSINSLKSLVKDSLDKYDDTLFKFSQERLESSIKKAFTLDEVKKIVLEEKKVALVPWFNDLENEKNFKNEKLGFGPRCIKESIVGQELNCFYSGKKATDYVYFGRSY